MSEWWAYSLSDFLMFSARSYFRQFELLNRELWPLQVLALGVGVLIAASMLRIRPAGMKIAFALLGLAWLWVAWAYHLQRYADINTGAPYFAAGFGIQAGSMGWLALRRQVLPAGAAAGRLALAIVVLSLAVYPLLAPLNGRSWWQAEVFAIAPDPTVAATFGALLFWRAPWPLWLIPVLWSAASSATLFELRAPQAWLLMVVALVAMAAALKERASAARK